MKGKPAFFMYVSGLILFQSRAGVNYPVSHTYGVGRYMHNTR